MKPIEFKGQTMEFASSQGEYITLPAHFKDNIVTSCWSVSILERFRIMFNGKIFVQQLTFGKPLQAQKLSPINPIEGKT
jgi:hypothetical protein